MSRRVFLRKAKQINLPSEISQHSTTCTHTEHWYSRVSRDEFLFSQNMITIFRKSLDESSRRVVSASVIKNKKYLRVCTFAIVEFLFQIQHSTQQHLIYEFLMRVPVRDTTWQTIEDFSCKIYWLFFFVKQHKIFKTCSNVDSDECGVFAWKTAPSGQGSRDSKACFRKQNGFLSICFNN